MALGLNYNQVVKDELASGALNARGTEFEFDAGDYIRQGWGALFGKDYSKSALQAKALELQTQRINDQLGAANTTLGSYGAAPITRKAGETGQEAELRGQQGIAFQQSLAEAKVNNPNIDLSGVTTVGELASRISGWKGDKARKAEKKEADAIEREENRYWRDREDARDLKVSAQEAKQEGLRLQIAEMASQRQSNERVELQGLENNLALAQLENARLVAADENRRADRKEKAMMTLLGAGLDGLGAAMGMVF